MPIPSKMPSVTRFGDLNGPYGSLVCDLTRGRLNAKDWCHLDPDIREDSLPRETGWRGALGQVSTAQRHLANQGIRCGDLFIFWGLFRSVENNGRWKFVGRPEHRVWGWLQIGEMIDLGGDGSHALAKRPWLCHHPHTRAGWTLPNVLYLASEELVLGCRKLHLPGSGTLKTGYRLSDAGANCSTWRVPKWLNLRLGGCGMSYHPLDRWRHDGTLRCAARGQEFVAAPRKDGEASLWLMALLEGTLK
jgi:hypothetical protein